MLHDIPTLLIAVSVPLEKNVHAGSTRCSAGLAEVDICLSVTVSCAAHVNTPTPTLSVSPATSSPLTRCSHVNPLQAAGN